MFGTKTLLAVAIATTALSGSAAIAAATHPAPAVHTSAVKARATKTTATTSCRNNKGRFVKCAKTTRATTAAKPAMQKTS